MEDIFTYIIVFGVILGGVTIWQLRRSKARPYILSQQLFPAMQLKVVVEKREGKTQDLILEVISVKSMQLENIYIELIASDRSRNLVEATSINSNIIYPINCEPKQKIRFVFPFEVFKSQLLSSGHKFKTFRIVGQFDNGNKYKSHEMAFNKNWVIYRPDSGTYN